MQTHYHIRKEKDLQAWKVIRMGITWIETAKCGSEL